MTNLLETTATIDVLNNYIILYRNDFGLNFGSDGNVYSVFTLLKKACLELANISYKVCSRNIHKDAVLPDGLYSNFLYSRMMWSKLFLYYTSLRFQYSDLEESLYKNYILTRF